MFKLTLKGAPQLIMYYRDKSVTTQAVNRRVIQTVGRLGLFELVKRTPVFSGDLLKSLRPSYYYYGGAYSVRLGYNERDRLKGHRYVQYAENGRGPAYGRNSPKQYMRFWRTPNLGYDSLKSNADRNIVFRKRVGPAQGHHMIRDTRLLLSREIRGLAKLEVDRWLQK